MNELVKRAQSYEAADGTTHRYITPETVQLAIDEGVPVEKVRLDTLEVLANIAGCGAEDRSLCAFVAFFGGQNPEEVIASEQ